MGKKRGQLFSMDMMFAATIVLFLFVAMTVVHDMLFYSFQTSTAKAEMRDSTLAAADVLVSSAGNPSNWSDSAGIDAASVKVLGLASERGVLDPAKVAGFFQSINTTTLNSNYSNARRALGLNRPGYNFSVTIYNSTGDKILETNASIAPSASNSTASMQRYALLNGELARLNVRVWKDEST